MSVPNLEVCVDKGILGAFCAYTNTDKTRDVEERAWAVERFGYFCMSPENFAKNQRFFEEACEQTKNCKIEELRERFEKFNTAISR